MLEWLKLLMGPMLKLIERKRESKDGPSQEWKRRQLEELYGPLRTTLLDCHITIVTSAKYPRLRDRFRRAWKGKNWRQLFDRGEKESAEAEFGALFPTETIAKIVAAKTALADPELLRLVQAARRAEYEEAPKQYERALGPAELELAKHISERHAELGDALEQ